MKKNDIYLTVFISLLVCFVVYASIMLGYRLGRSARTCEFTQEYTCTLTPTYK